MSRHSDVPALARSVAAVVDTALGRAHRDDPALPRSGGPAGNARLTAWTGLLLLALFVVECATLLSLRRLIGLHIALGTALVPLVVLKTATTGWRMARYYAGDPAYRRAGPPPLLLRLLGPLVVLTGLAVLGSGLALIPLAQATYQPLLSVAGQRLDALTIHKLTFVAWFGVVGAHTLTRLIPAARLAASPRAVPVAGTRARWVVLVSAAAVGVVVALAVLRVSTPWTSNQLTRQVDVQGSDSGDQ